mmetsp:Transcript_73973/g.239127  ORF Transcript_73973/g.239127 Transcript_73973/m.239127 type:complete len:246 (-) Transcript_73973:1390-2127(-)
MKCRAFWASSLSSPKDTEHSCAQASPCASASWTSPRIAAQTTSRGATFCRSSAWRSPSCAAARLSAACWSAGARALPASCQGSSCTRLSLAASARARARPCSVRGSASSAPAVRWRACRSSAPRGRPGPSPRCWAARHSSSRVRASSQRRPARRGSAALVGPGPRRGPSSASASNAAPWRLSPARPRAARRWQAAISQQCGGQKSRGPWRLVRSASARWAVVTAAAKSFSSSAACERRSSTRAWS